MIFVETSLKGAFILDLELLEDERGFFARSFCQREFEAHGLNPTIAQSNIAFNSRKGTLRGMHFQYPPCGETKLVRVVSGALLDIIIDLRPESTTYLQHVAVELTAHNRRALYVPARFAHGYQVLTDNTEVCYDMGDFYAPQMQSGLRYDDPALALSWPLPVSEISRKDSEWPLLSEARHILSVKMTEPGAASADRIGSV